MNPRCIRQEDWWFIKSALQFVIDKGGLLPSLTDVDTALAGVWSYHDERQAFIVGGFLVLFDIGLEWYSNKKMFCEKLVLKLDKKADASLVPAYLENLARMYKCDVLLAGDSLAGRMTPHYESAGWSHLGSTLMKEITPCVEESSASSTLVAS